MPSDITTWLKFALQQMAAESYLDGINLQDPTAVIRRLVNGNNNSQVIPADQFTGNTRFVDLAGVTHAAQITGSAQAFASSYQIVDHHANDASGFSATLMREIGTNNFTLSFRSTEFKNQVDGGDYERDGANLPLLTGADGEITKEGFAFGQLAAMEHYYQSIVKPLLPAGTVLNVTGYSLGAHLATVFTELHELETNNAFSFGHTYTFNGPGRGEFSGGQQEESVEATQIRAMITRLTEVLTNPMSGIAQGTPEELWPPSLNAALLAQQLNPTWNPWESGSTQSVYSDSRYLWAKQVVEEEFSPVSRSLADIPRTDGAFDLITQIVGHATQSDTEYVANSGDHAPETRVYIEDQSDLDGFGGFFGASGDFGTTHSITLIVDSLATQELFQTIAPALAQSDIEAILATSSNQQASGFIGTSGVAEGNSLENALDALGKLFVPNYMPTQFGRGTGDFGSLTFRTPFYANLAAVKIALAGATVTVEPFVEMGVVDGQPKALPRLTPNDVVSEAQQDTDRGMAFRYALRALNPFAVIGADYSGLGHAANGQLALFDPATGFGEMTPQYLMDRAAFLETKTELGLINQEKSTDTIHFRDVGSNYEITTTALFEVDNRQFLFGGKDGDALQGEGLDDHLYGGDGHDVLMGQGGQDYLEGNQGNDILVGGTENDTLKGGAGFDTYIYNSGDGTDRIEDTQGQNTILFDQQLLQGGIRQAGGTEYTSPDGRFTYAFSGTDLIVNGSLILNDNFQNGQFGIRLVDLPAYAEVTRTEFLKVDHYVRVGTNPDGTPMYDPVYASFFDDLSNDTRNTTPVGGLTPPLGDENNLLHALGGNDYIRSGAGDDQLYGEGGNDEIYGGLGNDRLYGGGEDDLLYGDGGTNSTSGGDDYLDGGDGNDVLQGGAGRDILLGGAGNDALSGDETAGSDPGASDNSGAFDDWLDGGSGDDILHGGSGGDVLIGGAGNDWLIGDTTQYQSGRPEQGGNDVLDGGSGDDELDGLYGDDVLNGGSGKDLVNGQDGSDVLYGGDDNDILSGDLRIKSIGGGYAYDTNEYRDAGGDDLLFGEDGNDIMIGGEGSDTLEGDIGDDSLFGGYNTGLVSSSDPLYWTLFTASGSDWLDAGAGNDVVHGGVGTDTLLGEEGDDLLVGSGGDDELEGGAGDDRLYGDYIPNQFVGNPYLSQITALAGNDRLDGGDGNDSLDGGNGNDMLYGGSGDDTIQGGDGADLLYGRDGVDALDGGSGDDELHGGSGNDYLTAFFAGHDTLYGEDGDDFLSSGLEPLFSDEGNLTPATGDSTLIGGLGNDTYEIDSSRDVVVEAVGEGIDTVNSFVSDTLPDAVENLNLRGVALTGVGNNLDNVLTGGNRLEGLGGDDTLIGLGWLDGGTGNDVLQGGTGSAYFSPEDNLLHILANTYVFAPGFGHDTIQETDPVFNSSYYQNEDTLAFALGISPSDVAWERSGNDLLLTVNGATDQISIPSFYDLRFDRGGYVVNGVTPLPQGIVSTSSGGFPTYVAPSRVEVIQFADGTIWHADHFGAPLLGDFRADTYDFGRGSGEFTIIDFDFTQSNTFRETDTIRVGAGVSSTDLTVSRVNGDDLVLSINGTPDRLTLQSLFKSVTVIPPFSFFGYSVAPYLIEQAQFADGTVWGVSDLINRISTFIGTSGDDTLFGNQNDNLIQGLSGDDVLSGQGGNDVVDGGLGDDRLFGDAGTDTLTGGQGDDTMSGGAGDDTYVFNLGDGVDTIEDTAAVGEGNRIQFGAGIAQADLTFTRDEAARVLMIQVGSSGTDQLRLLNFDPAGANGSLAVETQTFADGSTLNLAELFPRNQAPTLAAPLADQTVPEDAPFTLVVPANTFEDADAGGKLTLRASLADGMTLPAWLTFDATTAMFSGTPDDAQVGSLDLRVAATDSGNLTVSDVFTLTVINVNEAPTVAAPLADQQAAEDTAFGVVVPDGTFADVDAGDTLAYSAGLADGTALPSWLSFDPVTRTFSGTPGAGTTGTLQIAVMATDTGALSATDTFTFTISGPLPQTIIGTDSDDVLIGGRGEDTLTGLGGNDLLEGGLGSDKLIGGSGNDTYVVDSTGDIVTEFSNEGIDTVQSSVTYALGAKVENLTLTGTAAINGTGNSLNNILTGNSAANVLAGGAGNDVYVIGAGDSVVEQANQGFDTIVSDVTTTLSANVELLVLTGTNAIDGTGNSLNNGLTGTNAANVLDGGAGADVMTGRDGDDSYVVDNSSDVVVELANQGNDTVRSSVSCSLAANVEHLTLTGAGPINGIGNSLDNILIGNSAVNTLAGGKGNDLLAGGLGNDVLDGGQGDDTFRFFLGDGQDIVQDSSGSADLMQFGTGINPLDLVVSRRANDLRLAIHSTTDYVTLQNWYAGSSNRTETIQAGNGQTLLSTQVDQLIQAMASFSQQSGLTWDQAIDQRPQDVQTVLAASWQ